jgi:hypothetical protein
MRLDKPQGAPDETIGWGSDIAAEMLRRLDIPFVSLNPGASYRGLHDSLVNHLGNERPAFCSVCTKIIRSPSRMAMRAYRRADGLRAARQRRPAARHDGDVQRLV